MDKYDFSNCVFFFNGGGGVVVNFYLIDGSPYSFLIGQNFLAMVVLTTDKTSITLGIAVPYNQK